MADHDYNYRLDGSNMEAVFGLDNVRLFEGVAGKRADMLEIAYRHGAYVASRHWTKARLMRMDVLFPGGTPAQIYAAKEALEDALLNGTPTLTRDDPVNGDQNCTVLVSDPVEQPAGAGRFQWAYPVWQIEGYWEDAADTQDVDDTGLTTTGTIALAAIGGTHPTEPVFTIDCVSDGDAPAIEYTAEGDTLSIVGSYVTSDQIVIDVPNRLVTLNGSRAKNLLRINRGFWMEFANGATPSLDWTADSGTWDVNTIVRDRFRG